MNIDTSGYWSTADITKRFRCTSRTIYRRMKKENNPFPPPAINQAGAHNLWRISDVLQWEEAVSTKVS